MYNILSFPLILVKTICMEIFLTIGFFDEKMHLWGAQAVLPILFDAPNRPSNIKYTVHTFFGDRFVGIEAVLC
jgi:hypothetical protein